MTGLIDYFEKTFKNRMKPPFVFLTDRQYHFKSKLRFKSPSLQKSLFEVRNNFGIYVGGQLLLYAIITPEYITLISHQVIESYKYHRNSFNNIYIERNIIPNLRIFLLTSQSSEFSNIDSTNIQLCDPDSIILIEYIINHIISKTKSRITYKGNYVGLKSSYISNFNEPKLPPYNKDWLLIKNAIHDYEVLKIEALRKKQKLIARKQQKFVKSNSL